MAGHLGVETPGDPPTPPSPRRRRVLRRRGLKKSTSGDRAQLKVLQNKGFGEIMSRFPRKIVGRSKNCAHFSILREGDRPDIARGAFSPAKPVKNRPLPGSTTSAATSLRTRIDLRSRIPIHVVIQKFFQKSPKLTQNLYPLSSRAYATQERQLRNLRSFLPL